MSAPQPDAVMRAVAEVVVNEEKARADADRELAAELERLHKRLDSIDLMPIVPPELAEQVALAVRALHESPPVAEPKSPPPPKVIRIERDANGSMVPILQRAVMRFTATRDFFSQETSSHYVAGLSYQARPQDKLLLALIPLWIEDGLVREGGPQATLSGKE